MTEPLQALVTHVALHQSRQPAEPGSHIELPGPRTLAVQVARSDAEWARWRALAGQRRSLVELVPDAWEWAVEFNNVVTGWDVVGSGPETEDPTEPGEVPACILSDLYDWHRDVGGDLVRLVRRPVAAWEVVQP